MKTSLFDYELPEELIARYPAQPRDHSRLIVLNRQDQTIEHSHFYAINNYLEPGDVLVLNNSKVVPARLIGKKLPYGGKVELLLVREIQPSLWLVLVKPGKKIGKGDRIVIKEKVLEAEIVGYGDVGERIVKFYYQHDWWPTLEELGYTPLPPYILKARKHLAAKGKSVPLEENGDRERYQTVFAEEPGSVAAPTGGLHFTAQLLDDLKHHGIDIAYITLHIGPATFKPVTVEEVENHRMHPEFYQVSEEAANIINAAKTQRRRIVAVGSTPVRVLETLAEETGPIRAAQGETKLMIYPPYRFKCVDAIITNFHLPRSTLIMLVAAFASWDFINRAYQEAIERRYRFYSYGDAMLII